MDRLFKQPAAGGSGNEQPVLVLPGDGIR